MYRVSYSAFTAHLVHPVCPCDYCWTLQCVHVCVFVFVNFGMIFTVGTAVQFKETHGMGHRCHINNKPHS